MYLLVAWKSTVRIKKTSKSHQDESTAENAAGNEHPVMFSAVCAGTHALENK